jgi:hypothetical protein
MVSGCGRAPHNGMTVLLRLLGQEHTPFLDRSKGLQGIHDDQRAWVGCVAFAVVAAGEKPRGEKYIQMRREGELCPLGTTEYSHMMEILHVGGCARGRGSAKSGQPTMSGDDDAHESSEFRVDRRDT